MRQRRAGPGRPCCAAGGPKINGCRSACKMDKEVRAETLRLLSSGYVMLGRQHKCPRCGGPLFKHRDTEGEVVCPSCKIGGDEKESPKECPTPDTQGDTKTELPYKEPCDRDTACERLGELLIKGWRMLAEECPKGCCVPLMQQKSKEPGFCVACLSQVDIQ